MGTYRDNTPNFNVKKVKTFTEFDVNKEIKGTEDLKRTFTKNSDRHKFPKNSKLNYNDKTSKMDDTTMDIVDDKLKSLKSIEEFTKDSKKKK